MCSYNAQGDGASVKTTDMSTTGTYSHLSSGCGKKYGNVTGAKDLADADFALHHDEIENKFNQGIESTVLPKYNFRTMDLHQGGKHG